MSDVENFWTDGKNGLEKRDSLFIHRCFRVKSCKGACGKPGVGGDDRIRALITKFKNKNDSHMLKSTTRPVWALDIFSLTY